MKRIDLEHDVTDDASNANKGTQRGLGLLTESIDQLGAGRSIVVDAHGRIVAGNKSRAAMVAAGMREAIVVETDGHTPVVVKRTDWDLTDPKGPARRYAYYDNRVAELDLDWDKDELRKSLEEGTDLSALWSDDELRKMCVLEPEMTAGMMREEPPRFVLTFKSMEQLTACEAEVRAYAESWGAEVSVKAGGF